MRRKLASTVLVFSLCVGLLIFVGTDSAFGGGGNPGTGGWKYSGPGMVGDLVIVPDGDYDISFSFTSQCQGEGFTTSGLDEVPFSFIESAEDLDGYIFAGGISFPKDCTPKKATEYFPFINKVINFVKLTESQEIIATVVVLFEVPANK